MLNSTYGAGYRCGVSPAVLISIGNGLKVLAKKCNYCPFPKRRFISRQLWLLGCETGIKNKLGMKR